MQGAKLKQETFPGLAIQEEILSGSDFGQYITPVHNIILCQ